MTAPRWEDVPATDYDAEARAWVVGYLTSLRDDEAAEVAWRRADDNGTYVEATARMHEANLRWLDAALARLAEPEPREKFRAMVAEVGELPTSVLAVPAMPTDEGDEAAVDALMRRAAEGAAARPLTRVPTAAERWRAVPERGRAYVIRGLETDRVSFSSPKMMERHPERADIAAALDALLALAREAERGAP